jgi:hypothetical protein
LQGPFYTGPGSSGRAYGSGGVGSVNSAQQSTNFSGGSGASGVVIVEEYT